MWKRLEHPNILRLAGATANPPMLVSRWMSGGNLTDYIQANPGTNRLRLVGTSFVTSILRSPGGH